MVRRAPRQVSGSLTRPDLFCGTTFLPEDLTFAPLVLSLLRGPRVRIPIPPWRESIANLALAVPRASHCSRATPFDLQRGLHGTSLGHRAPKCFRDKQRSAPNPGGERIVRRQLPASIERGNEPRRAGAVEIVFAGRTPYAASVLQHECAQGAAATSTSGWEEDPVWDVDPVLRPFRDLPRTGRLVGYAGPPNRNAAEVVTKYIIVDMYAKAIQGMAAEDAVNWAHEELVKIYG